MVCIEWLQQLERGYAVKNWLKPSVLINVATFCQLSWLLWKLQVMWQYIVIALWFLINKLINKIKKVKNLGISNNTKLRKRPFSHVVPKLYKTEKKTQLLFIIYCTFRHANYCVLTPKCNFVFLSLQYCFPKCFAYLSHVRGKCVLTWVLYISAWYIEQ